MFRMLGVLASSDYEESSYKNSVMAQILSIIYYL
jgi:hypothetical protein